MVSSTWTLTSQWRPLLLLGLVAHALYALSLVKLYFSSPTSWSAASTTVGYADHAPAKRVVLFVADEWTADAFFSRRGRLDAPFLRDVVEHRGSWGVAHNLQNHNHSHLARHRAVLGANGIDFDSILNASRQSWILGRPRLDLAASTKPRVPPTKSKAKRTRPSTKGVLVKKTLVATPVAPVGLVDKLWAMVARPAAPSVHLASPSVHPTNTSRALVIFSPNRSDLVNGSRLVVDDLSLVTVETPKLVTSVPKKASSVHKQPSSVHRRTKRVRKTKTKAKAKSVDDSCFARLHDLLYEAPEELDRDGALFFCPFGAMSSDRLDHLVSVSVNAIERFYEHDGATTFVFTSSRGQGRMPFVAWGAGIQQPVRPPRRSATTKTSTKTTPVSTFKMDMPTQSRTQIEARLATQDVQEDAAKKQWGLLRSVRKDLLQTDIPALLSALLGIRTPRQSLGVVPSAYLPSNRYRAQSVMTNARDMLRRATATMQAKQAHSLLSFRPYAPFQKQVPMLVEQLETAWADDDLEAVEHLSQDLIDLSLDTIAYTQRYELAFIVCFLVAACLAWVGILAIALATSSFAAHGLMGSVDTWFAVFVVANAAFLALEHAPLTFFMFVASTVVAGNLVWRHAEVITTNARLCWLVVLGLATALELVIFRWQHRYVFTMLLVLFSIWPLLAKQLITRVISFVGLAFAVIKYASTEHSNDALLVELAGLALVVLAISTLARSFSVSLGPWVLGMTTSLGMLHASVHYLSNHVAPPVAFILLATVLALVSIITLAVEASSPRFGVSMRGKIHPSRTHGYLLQLALGLAPTPVVVLLSFPFEAMVVVALLGLLVAMLENLRTSTATSSKEATPLKAKLADLTPAMPVAATC